MRTDLISPRTWLLLTVVLWAGLVWLLALGGMGKRIAPLRDDPSLVQALPSLPGSSKERLGPLDPSSNIIRRPVFTADRKPHPFFLEGQGTEQAEKSFDYELTSVLITPRVRLAILQSPGEDAAASSVRIKLGDALPASPGWRLTELEPRRAVFDGPDGQRTLELRVFNGQGGQSPTPVSNAQQRAPGLAPAGAPPSGGRPIPSARQKPVDATHPDKPAQVPPSPEQQMQAIRERVEARRRQMLEQQKTGAPATNK